MKHLDRRTHGVFDYLFGALVAASPWLFGFSGQHLAPQIATTIGGAIIFYSLITNYERGVIRLLPFAGHRFFDLVTGVALLGAPWHFAMEGVAGTVFFSFGLVQLATVVLTRRPRDMATTA